MDNQLIQHISRLLPAYDCITVPGVGALILRTEPAVLNPDGLIEPPRRRVLFCRDMNHNDGLLVRAYVRSMGVTRNQAEKALRADIDALLEQLQTDHGLNIPAVGMLHYDTAGQLNFTPALQPNFLPTLKLDSVLDMVNPERQTPVAVEFRPAKASGATSWRRVKIAASIAVLLAIGIAVSTPIPTSNAQHASPVLEQFTPRKADKLAAVKHKPIAKPIAKPEEAKLEEAKLEEAKPAQAKPIAKPAEAKPIAKPAEAKPIAKPAEAKPAQAKPTEAAPLPRLNPDDAYCLVVASLPDADAAREFMAKAGRPMLMFQADGRYRVYAMTASNKADLQRNAAQSGLKQKYPTSWACAL